MSEKQVHVHQFQISLITHKCEYTRGGKIWTRTVNYVCAGDCVEKAKCEVFHAGDNQPTWWNLVQHPDDPGRGVV